MEFEVAAFINRIRNILLDVSVTIDEALRSTRSAVLPRQIELEVEGLDFARGLIQHLALLNDIVYDRTRFERHAKRESGSCRQISIVSLQEARAELQALGEALTEERLQHKRAADTVAAMTDGERSVFERITANHKKKIFSTIMETEDEIRKMKESDPTIMNELQIEIRPDSRHHKLGWNAKNVSNERELYQKRSKAEAAYLGAVAKYDTEVGALYRTMNDVTDQSNCLERKLKRFRNQLAIQDLEYVELREERERTIQKAFTEQLESFTKNRAAKIIQKAWRSFHQLWCIRKKKKSKKKKK